MFKDALRAFFAVVLGCVIALVGLLRLMPSDWFWVLVVVVVVDCLLRVGCFGGLNYCFIVLLRSFMIVHYYFAYTSLGVVLRLHCGLGLTGLFLGVVDCLWDLLGYVLICCCDG